MMYCPEMKKDLENECIAYKSMMACAEELKNLKNKLHRRNMQIKELKIYKTAWRRIGLV